ncbi:hypothetical protein ACJJTC_000196, partial [Scirpophaga incertulas]
VVIIFGTSLGEGGPAIRPGRPASVRTYRETLRSLFLSDTIDSWDPSRTGAYGFTPTHFISNHCEKTHLYTSASSHRVNAGEEIAKALAHFEILIRPFSTQL